MDATPAAQAARETERVRASREELVERTARAIRGDGTVEPLPGLQLRRASSPTELGHGVSDTAFCVLAQGRKEVLLGQLRYEYDPAHYLVSTAAVPIASRIVEATAERPYLRLLVRLDPAVVGSVTSEAGYVARQSRPAAPAIDVSRLDEGLLDAALRLVRLLDSPVHARFLAPLVTREIVYRLLVGEQGNRLRSMTALGGHRHGIARAIERLRKEFDHPLRIEDVARAVGMSVSGFHHHFRAVTGMSPLQFQKQLRLQHARRLMLSEDLDAASAGYRVGYHDPSHFSREYKQLFGLPPMRDVERLRGAAPRSAGL